MSIDHILKSTSHRPFPIPNSSWQIYQEWNRVIFLHYRVNFDQLRKLVPPKLTIDCFESQAWVSVVAFTMENVHPRYLPPFSPISNFDEINIRTYVSHNGVPAVYFLSIEAGKKLSAFISRKISGLPYRYSKMSRTPETYESYNSEFNDQFKISFKVNEAHSGLTDLDLWLCERYALFQDYGNKINSFHLHHLPWQLNKLQIDELAIKYPRFESFGLGEPDCAHYSSGIQVVSWKPKSL